MSIERDPQPVPGAETVKVDREWFMAAMERGVPWPNARTFSVTNYEKPWTMNYQRGTASRWKVVQLTAEWRGRFHYLARQQHIPKLDRVTITVDHQTRTNRLPDTCAIAPAYKAALDGLVDAGVLPDDGPEHVTAVTFLPSHRTGRDGLLVLTDYQWEQLATQAGITAPAGARVAVGPDTRHQVAALLKGRRALPADPFADLPTY